jgi:hypothetical protein
VIFLLYYVKILGFNVMEKPIPFDSVYIMKSGMSYHDVCLGMRLDDSEIEAGIKALELLNGPDPTLMKIEKASEKND